MAKELYAANLSEKMFLMGEEMDPVAHVLSRGNNL